MLNRWKYLNGIDVRKYLLNYSVDAQQLNLTLKTNFIWSNCSLCKV